MASSAHKNRITRDIQVDLCDCGMPPKRKVAAEEKVVEAVASPVVKKAKKANSVTIEHCKSW